MLSSVMMVVVVCLEKVMNIKVCVEKMQDLYFDYTAVHAQPVVGPFQVPYLG